MYVSLGGFKAITLRGYLDKYIFPAYILSVVTLILTVPSLYDSAIPDKDTLFMFTSLMIGIISFFMVLYESGKHPYSLHLMHWLFLYTFFFIAPMMQYLNDSFQWGLLNSSNIEALRYSNYIILAWQVIWIATRFFTNYKSKPTVEVKFAIGSREITFLFISSFAVLAYFIYIYGFTGIFTRGAQIYGSISSNSSVALLFLYIGRSIPLVLFAALIHARRAEGKSGYDGKIIMSLLLILLTSFPSATPRFWTAAVYVGVFIIIARLRSKSLLILLLIAGLIVAFPLLGAARGSSTFSEFVGSISINKTLTDNIISYDYDAFSMLTYTHVYTSDVGSSLGKQLLTVLLFFVPRSIWPDKSIGSGQVIANHLGLIFNNVSCPLPAEGLMNFGIPGLIVFAIFFSMLLTKIDRIYWAKSSPLVTLAYPFWLALFFYMMRGDLLASMSFSAGITAVFYAFTRGSKKKENNSY